MIAGQIPLPQTAVPQFPAALTCELAGVEGLEPPASGFGDRRSSQLSYTPTVGRRSLHGIRRDEGRRKDVRATLSSVYGLRTLSAIPRPKNPNICSHHVLDSVLASCDQSPRT
jgi:hypothetical protein